MTRIEWRYGRFAVLQPFIEGYPESRFPPPPIMKCFIDKHLHPAGPPITGTQYGNCVSEPRLTTPERAAFLSPEILTCRGSFLTIFWPRFDVEAEGEVGLGNDWVAGVELVAQRHQGFGVAWGAELIEVNVQLAVG